MSSIELPRDAEGLEIPLDTKVLYDKNGMLRNVWHFDFRPNYGNNGRWTVVLENKCEKATSSMYLNMPDTWGKLEEDLDRCIEGDSSCFYYTEDGNCRNCPLCNEVLDRCNSKVYIDIKKRIRNLNGENHDC